MKRSLILVAAVAALVGAVTASVGLLAAPASSAGTAKPRPGSRLLPPATPAGQMSLYGHIASLRRTSGRFELRFDPAWFTSGGTARRAKRADTGSSDVPNDNYVVEEGHRLLTFVVPTRARITVLTNDGTGLSSTPITVAELARIVNGGRHRKLFEPLDSGVWIRVRVDTVRELAQQYRP